MEGLETRKRNREAAQDNDTAWMSIYKKNEIYRVARGKMNIGGGEGKQNSPPPLLVILQCNIETNTRTLQTGTRPPHQRARCGTKGWDHEYYITVGRSPQPTLLGSGERPELPRRVSKISIAGANALATETCGAVAPQSNLVVDFN